MPAKSPQTVFISHSSRDRQVTEELYQALKKRGDLDCWMDNYDLNAEGGAFPAQIVSALQRAGALALVDTPASRASDYVQRELQTARDLQIPVLRYRVKEPQPAWQTRLAIGWLRLRLQVQLQRGFLSAAGVLALLLIALALVLYVFGTQVAPRINPDSLRDLPAAFRPTPTPTATPDPADPAVAAPFHFRPAALTFQEEFNDPAYENKVNEQELSFSFQSDRSLATISQRAGSLVLNAPLECLDSKNFDNCRLMLYSQEQPIGKIQYLGMRIRVQQGTYMRDVMVGLFTTLPNEMVVGFGWDLTDKAMAFFQSPPDAPEKAYDTLVQIGHGWHAYEILRDPQQSRLYYYVDGQLVGSYTPVHGSAWAEARLPWSMYTYLNKLSDPTGVAEIPTHVEIDEVLVGSFAP